MCNGTVHKTICGHPLVHFTRRCPLRCPLPTSGPVFTLDDTCAACHPSYRTQELTAKYELARTHLNSRLRAAQDAGRPDEAAAVREAIMGLHSRHIAELQEAKRFKTGGAEVVWPGKHAEAAAGPGEGFSRGDAESSDDRAARTEADEFFAMDGGNRARGSKDDKTRERTRR